MCGFLSILCIMCRIRLWWIWATHIKMRCPRMLHWLYADDIVAEHILWFPRQNTKKTKTLFNYFSVTSFVFGYTKQKRRTHTLKQNKQKNQRKYFRALNTPFIISFLSLFHRDKFFFYIIFLSFFEILCFPYVLKHKIVFTRDFDKNFDQNTHNS